jgi:hypothetical protein
MSVDQSEKKFAKNINGKLTVASGAKNDDSDIIAGDYIIECKRRDSENPNNIIFYKKYWNKLIKQGIKHNKEVAYVYISNDEEYVFVDHLKGSEWVINEINYVEKTNIIINKDEYDTLYRSNVNTKYAIKIGNKELFIISMYRFKRMIEND